MTIEDAVAHALQEHGQYADWSLEHECIPKRVIAQLLQAEFRAVLGPSLEVVALVRLEGMGYILVEGSGSVIHKGFLDTWHWERGYESDWEDGRKQDSFHMSWEKLLDSVLTKKYP